MLSHYNKLTCRYHCTKKDLIATNTDHIHVYYAYRNYRWPECNETN